MPDASTAADTHTSENERDDHGRTLRIAPLSKTLRRPSWAVECPDYTPAALEKLINSWMGTCLLCGERTELHPPELDLAALGLDGALPVIHAGVRAVFDEIAVDPDGDGLAARLDDHRVPLPKRVV